MKEIKNNAQVVKNSNESAQVTAEQVKKQVDFMSEQELKELVSKIWVVRGAYIHSIELNGDDLTVDIEFWKGQIEITFPSWGNIWISGELRYDYFDEYQDFIEYNYDTICGFLNNRLNKLMREKVDYDETYYHIDGDEIKKLANYFDYDKREWLRDNDKVVKFYENR